MLFQEITGLSDTKEHLIEAIKSNHIAHAQLFFGSEGGAGLAMAMAYITYLHCENKGETDACGKCSGCIKCNKLIHPDFNLVFPVINTEKIAKATSKDFIAEFRTALISNPYLVLRNWLDCMDTDTNKQGNIPVEESRNILSTLALKASESEFKTILIWLPELMNMQAANAILKILEEPPQKTVFMLVSNDYQKLLPTILSRVQTIQIPDFSEQEISNYLIQRTNVESEKATQIAYLSGSNLNKAIYLSQEITHNPAELIHDWLRACYKMDFKDLMQKAEIFSKMNKDAQKNLMLYGIRIFRDALFLKQDISSLVKLENEELSFAQKFSSVVHLQNVGYLYQLLNEAFFHLERNANAKIVFLDTSLKLAEKLKS